MVGDSLTRTLTLKAEGLSSAQLPALTATDVNGLRRYPDLPQLSNQITENGLIGSREEREALVPTRVGQVELPAVEVVWWNTHEDRLERSLFTGAHAASRRQSGLGRGRCGQQYGTPPER